MGVFSVKTRRSTSPSISVASHPVEAPAVGEAFQSVLAGVLEGGRSPLRAFLWHDSRRYVSHDYGMTREPSAPGH
ncbi:MAG: hypothetical protein QOE25_1165 [Actinomycetota bacterium]|jgi:hypothetical protein|nr:hypothetical protein [Actinomycetota bacterium]